MFQQVKDPGCCPCEDVGTTPALAQWVKHPAIPQAEAQVTDAAQV